MSTDLTLGVDSSTYRGTVAVFAGARVLATAEVLMRGEREERLMPAIAAALGSAAVTVHDLGRVVAGGGPGSFTSLRIGAALAKGICTAAGIPMATVPSLALLVAGAEPPLDDGVYVAVLDAMRGDVYAALIEWRSGLAVTILDEQLIPRSAVGAFAARRGARVVGAGMEIDAMPHARGIARVADAMIHAVSLDTWEPAYGRLAEAQVKWEAEHGRSLATG
jgi:tRNA threonylcarbamoyladenosine biosynthesis protein TsaB